MCYIVYAIKRTTVFLDDRLLRQAQEQAEQEGKSFAQLVREAVSGYLISSQGPATRFPSVAGLFASGCAEAADRVDELLWREPHD